MISSASSSPTSRCSFAPELPQTARLCPGPTPNKNRTVRRYARRDPIKDEADREQCEKMINFLRDVTYGEDYVVGLSIQKGLESGAHEDILFGKNERGNQYFHEWLNWYLQDDPTLPKPVM